jgi:hypothetical protein
VLKKVNFTLEEAMKAAHTEFRKGVDIESTMFALTDHTLTS